NQLDRLYWTLLLVLYALQPSILRKQSSYNLNHAQKDNAPGLPLCHNNGNRHKAHHDTQPLILGLGNTSRSAHQNTLKDTSRSTSQKDYNDPLKYRESPAPPLDRLSKNE